MRTQRSWRLGAEVTLDDADAGAEALEERAAGEGLQQCV
jgi:hypothetical protein